MRANIIKETNDMRTSIIYVLAIILAAVTSAGIGARTSQQPAHASISQVQWLAGSWAGTAGPVAFEERWTPGAGGAMLAVSRTLKADRMVAFEFLRIIERNGGLVYIAQPNGQPPTEFVLTSLTAQSVTFENPTHDFPKMIRYEKRADGTLEARVSDGGRKIESFVFRHMP
jgi:hypothetical protein